MSDYIMDQVLADIARAAEEEYPPKTWPESGPRTAFIDVAVDQLVKKLVAMAVEEKP